LLIDWRVHYQEAFPDAASRATFFASVAGPSAFAL